jgi:hypothetical protein
VEGRILSPKIRAKLNIMMKLAFITGLTPLSSIANDCDHLAPNNVDKLLSILKISNGAQSVFERCVDDRISREIKDELDINYLSKGYADDKFRLQLLAHSTESTKSLTGSTLVKFEFSENSAGNEAFQIRTLPNHKTIRATK